MKILCTLNLNHKKKTKARMIPGDALFMIRQFCRLPQINSRQAKRAVASILERFAEKESDSQDFASRLMDLSVRTHRCCECSNVYLGEECGICLFNPNPTIICIVENLYELWRLQDIKISGCGFHILGGALSASAGITPRNLNVINLIERIKKNNVTETIIALSKNYDAVTTADYLGEVLNKNFPNLLITTLADGLPGGADFDFIDNKTIEKALLARVRLGA